MFWIIIILIQLVLWWITFFKTKKLVRTKIEESRWNSTTWSEFTLSNERYKFPLGIVLLGLLICFVPIIGFFGYIAVLINVSSLPDRNFEDERPSFAIVELFKKKV